VLLIVVDTLRADHTSLLGYERDTTPHLRALAEEGMLFTRHLVNAPWTKPSVASILTGLLPPAHGSQWGDFNRVASGKVDILAEGFDTLPEILRRHGYATVAMMTNTTITPEIGYAQGFDRFEQLGSRLQNDRESLRGALQALDHAERPTFVWCHLMAPHNYVLPEGRPRVFRSRKRTPIRLRDAYGPKMRRSYGFHFREPAIDTYDEVVRWVDQGVSGLVRRVRAKHPGTLILFTSDHGEELGEHGGYLHARTLHSEILHVPLVMWGPMIPRGEVVTRLSQSVDLLPTILDVLGLDPVQSQGRSLLAADAGDRPVVYAEKRNGSNMMRALVTPDGKLLESLPPGPPGEKPSRAGEGSWRFYPDPVGPDRKDALDALAPDELARRRAQLEEIWAASTHLFEERTAGGSSQRAIRDEEVEALRALGYLDEEASAAELP
jgi:arylsulfatase A-like enzyme